MLIFSQRIVKTAMPTHEFFSPKNMAKVADEIQATVRARTHVGEFGYRIIEDNLLAAMMMVAEENAGVLHANNVPDAVARLNRLTVEREADRLTQLSAGAEYIGDGYAPNTEATNGGYISNSGRIAGAGRLMQQRAKIQRDPDHAPNGANYTFGSNHMAKFHRMFRKHQENITARGMHNGLSSRFDMTRPAYERSEQQKLRQQIRPPADNARYL